MVLVKMLNCFMTILSLLSILIGLKNGNILVPSQGSGCNVNKLILLMERWLEHKKREYDFNVKAGEEKFLKDLEYKRRDLDQAIKQLIETTKSVVDKIQENMYPFLPVDVEGVGRLQVVAPIKNYEHVRYLVIIDGQTERYFCQGKRRHLGFSVTNI